MTVRRLLDEGTLGEVTLFESAFERFSPDEPVPAAGGGILRDFGAHLVDQALLLFGPVGRVCGELGAGEAVGGGRDGKEPALMEGRSRASEEWFPEPEERWGRLFRGEASEPVRS